MEGNESLIWPESLFLLRFETQYSGIKRTFSQNQKLSITSRKLLNHEDFYSRSRSFPPCLRRSCRSSQPTWPITTATMSPSRWRISLSMTDCRGGILLVLDRNEMAQSALPTTGPVPSRKSPSLEISTQSLPTGMCLGFIPLPVQRLLLVSSTSWLSG